MSKKQRKYGVIYQVKQIKRASKIKYTYREYNVKDDYDVAHKELKFYCYTNQFPTLPFCGPHPKPHGPRGFSKHYHLRFDPKIGHGIYLIFRIPYG